ncbi:HEAT repeat domain-containing protein [Planctomicrobium sp. SH661]|uniref:HEAT repeat domain-containing protein n=1 Tax=Planctomicrobium sp. SH661 TaxID=3448124 RepID=UPI003F5AF6C2
MRGDRTLQLTACCICLQMFLILLCFRAVSAAESEEVRYAGRTLPEWREFIKSEPLTSLGTPEVVAGLTTIIEDPAAPWADRRSFALTLGRLGAPAAPAVPALQRLLHNTEPDPDVTRLWVLKSLGLMGTVGRNSAEEVLAIVRNRNESFLIRSTAMETLVRIAPDNSATLSILIEILAADGEENPPEQVDELRRVAAETVALLGPEGAPALPELIRALQSDWPILQRSAASALGALGPRGELAVDPLLDVVLFAESSDAREAAVDALGAIGLPAVRALELLSKDDEQLVRELAVRGLRRSTAVAQAVEALRSVLKDDIPLIRIEAAAAILQHQPDHVAVRMLLDGLDEEDRETRMHAFRALREHLDQLVPYRPELEAMESNPRSNAQSRQAARKLLGLIEP